MATTCLRCGGKGLVQCARCAGTGREPRTPFKVERLKDWHQIREYREKFENAEDEYIFRGQKEATWRLRTSLERACSRFPADFRDPPEAERRLVREFRRRLHHYLSDVPQREDDLEWLSLIQHYGGPTRLLDFTRSIYVAAYFALEEAEDDCAVWVINADWAIRQCDAVLRKRHVSPKARSYLTRLIEDDMAPLFRHVFMRNPPVLLACPVNPFRLNERLTLQRGIFMCPGDVSQDFETNLCALEGHDERENVVKLVIPKAQREVAVKDLYKLSVIRTNLFPGLDGFAGSLRVWPPAGRDRTRVSKSWR